MSFSLSLYIRYPTSPVTIFRGYPRIYQKQKNQNNERNNDYLYREKLNLFVGTEFNVKTVLEVISWKEFVIPDKSLNVYVGTGDPLNVVLV